MHVACIFRDGLHARLQCFRVNEHSEMFRSETYRSINYVFFKLKHTQWYVHGIAFGEKREQESTAGISASILHKKY